MRQVRRPWPSYRRAAELEGAAAEREPDRQSVVMMKNTRDDVEPGLTVGGATFLAMGVACFLTIGQLQYQTLQARATQATEVHQVSTRAKNAPLMAR